MEWKEDSSVQRLTQYRQQEDPWVNYKLFSPQAKPPEKWTSESGAFELFSAENKEIGPSTITAVATDIGFKMPKHLVGMIVSVSDYFSNGVDAATTIISPDYNGPVTINLRNCSSSPLKINAGDRIARIVFTRVLNQRAIYTSSKFI